jgi:tRNA pseudouridine38-40 synthase
MTRFKLTIEYDGGPFSGWQKVGDGRDSVQARLEEAAAKLDGQACEVVGAGRTDAGVHALAQVAHVDLRKALSGFQVAQALTAQLRPHPIAVLRAEETDEGFHARFSAIGRSYLYRIINRRADLALDRGRAWRIAADVDAEAMAAAAQRLLGHHDFTTFRDAQCQAKSPIKTLDRFEVSRRGDEIRIVVEARSFLHRQVRSMVGTIAEAGLGKMSADDVAAALAAKDRAACGPVAPAEGLYLARVTYPAK